MKNDRIESIFGFVNIFKLGQISVGFYGQHFSGEGIDDAIYVIQEIAIM